MRILIATGIYPPHAGGPAYYAESIKKEFEQLGHHVTVRTFSVERHLPTGIRHLVYFFKTLPFFIVSDMVLVLDTFSVAVPVAMMQMITRRNTVMRIGGDFLWEQYVERTGEKILLSEFYTQPRVYTRKEKLIFNLTHWALSKMTYIVFTTRYQKNIWQGPYDISEGRISIIENAYEDRRLDAPEPLKKNFVCIVRRLKWKNIDTLTRAFEKAQEHVSDIVLDIHYDIPRSEAFKLLQSSYAVILVSLGDISPNLVLEALSFGKPVIMTMENGLRDRIGDTIVYVHPLDEIAITDAIVRMANTVFYTDQVRQVKSFVFKRSYADVAHDFLTLPETL